LYYTAKRKTGKIKEKEKEEEKNPAKKISA
jgi:hypothetical protein